MDHGSYDPALNITYWGVSQAKPWVRASRGQPGDKALYTSSTLALNPDTASWAGISSMSRANRSIMDVVFERVLVDSSGAEAAVHYRQGGILWKLDRTTGKFLDLQRDRFSERVRQHRPRPADVHYRNEILEQKIETVAASCPSTEGGHNWQAMSYNPGPTQLIIPLSQSCGDVGA